MHRAFGVAALSLVVAPLACGSRSSTQPGVSALFAIPGTLDALDGKAFFDHPFPSDFRRDMNGAIHLHGYYNPRQTDLLDQAAAAASGLTGFSPAGAIYLRFTGPLDAASLPRGDTAATDASVSLVDVDPKSPERGARKSIRVAFRKAEGVYVRGNTLSILPSLGSPLRANTRYAAVVTAKAKAEDGAAISPGGDLQEVLGLRARTPRTQAVRAAFGDATAELANAGVPLTSIVHLTVFTTGDPTALTFAMADVVHEQLPAPTVDAATWTKRTAGTNRIFEGTYGPSPTFQRGTAPFRTPADGGTLEFGADGKPKIQSTFSMRFSLVVPPADTCPMPAAGYPIVLYAHGTGGDYRTVYQEGGGVADTVVKAPYCFAAMGIDQIFHGARAGAPPLGNQGTASAQSDEFYSLFNLGNPAAARVNLPQAAIDIVQQTRLVSESHVTIPAEVTGGDPVTFDPSKIVFWGHSQGGLNGPLYVAADATPKAAVFSGTGSDLRSTLLERVSADLNVPTLVKFYLGLVDAEGDELDYFHPALTLVETAVDVGDSLHFMPFIVKHPRAANAPKSVYQSEGVNPDGTGDTETPPHSIEIASVALGLPRLAPTVHPRAEAAPAGLDENLAVPASGLTGNLAEGRATGGLVQLQQHTQDDPHFVLFERDDARAQVASFLASVVAGGPGKLPPLNP